MMPMARRPAAGCPSRREPLGSMSATGVTLASALVAGCSADGGSREPAGASATSGTPAEGGPPTPGSNATGSAPTGSSAGVVAPATAVPGDQVVLS